MSSPLQRQALKLPPTGLNAARHGRRLSLTKRRDFRPVHWKQYFKESKEVITEEGTFRVYTAGTAGPVIVLIHGGGFSALSWSLFVSCVMSFVECRVLAIDLRGHGDTVTKNDEDLSIDTLCRDVKQVLEILYGEEAPPIFLMGHSMGGAVAVHTAYAQYIPSLIGLAVIDVVEGTALDSLSSMQNVLRCRPKGFKSVEEAIEWCVRSGQVRNVESARVSMPGQITNVQTGLPATHEVSELLPEQDEDDNPEEEIVPALRMPEDPNAILEEEVSEGGQFKKPRHEEPAHKYEWRINLSKTQDFWNGWFEDLSMHFLECSVPQLLLLAGIDRLDKALTVGQMQGKFQMQVLPHCGHAVHEDVPDKVAEVIATFMVRHKFAEETSNFPRYLLHTNSSEILKVLKGVTCLPDECLQTIECSWFISRHVSEEVFLSNLL